MVLRVKQQDIGDLQPYDRNARIHDKKQVRQIANSIKQFGFNVPILIDGNKRIIAGHGRLMAAKELGLKKVPVISIEHLTEAQKRAFIIADNKLTENAGWNLEILNLEFSDLSNLDLGFDLDITGFSIGEIDLILNPDESDNEADIVPDVSETNIVTKLGDIWQLGEHRIICADSTKAETYQALLEGKKAAMVITDPPYNVKVDGHICGSGKIKHSEFAMASGEMSKSEFTEFLHMTFEQLAKSSKDGSIHFVFMDWRHMQEVLNAGDKNYTELKNLCVWNKSNAGMGSFYRSKHELVFVFKNGAKPHINNFELGQHGRYRTNVWDYAGVNSFSKSNTEHESEASDLSWHPTVKPVAMVADAIMDCSNHNDIIMDSFLGSGTTLIAAQKVKRKCYGIELEPKYVDVAIKRWQDYTGEKALNLVSGKIFDDLGAKND